MIINKRKRKLPFFYNLSFSIDKLLKFALQLFLFKPNTF